MFLCNFPGGNVGCNFPKKWMSSRDGSLTIDRKGEKCRGFGDVMRWIFLNCKCCLF